MTKKQILEALSHVQDPDLKKDLVTLNMIQDIKIDGNKIKFTLVLTTPACPLKDFLKKQCVKKYHNLFRNVVWTRSKVRDFLLNLYFTLLIKSQIKKYWRWIA